MKLLYIGDNSDSLNLGCRATSIALRQLAARHATFVGTVPTRMIAARWPMSDRIGDAAFGTAAKVLNTNRARAVPVLGAAVGGVMDALGTRDAIGHDLVANARVLERARAYSADARQLFVWLDECDGALVNGEGDLIFGTPARQRLLFILTLCHMLLARGKKLFYLNAMASPAPGQEPNRETLAIADDVLARADAFALRDPVSLEFAKTHLPRAAARARVYPDAVFAWSHRVAGYPLDHSTDVLAPYFEGARTCEPVLPQGPYLVVGGSSRAAYDKPRAERAYTALVEELRTLGLDIVIQPACTGDSFLEGVAEATGTPLFPIRSPILAHMAILANARLYVSGRWHPSILASLGGTPCVFMGSNSHKMLALQHQLGYPDPHEFDPWPDSDAIAGIVTEARALLDEGTTRRETIRTAAQSLGEMAVRAIDELVD